MKAIERYVFGSFLSSFLLAFLVLSFVLTIGLLVQIVGYIIDGMPMRLVGEFAAVSFPETLQWTIPLALLVSSVLVFSRLSADSEIAAMRACGINLLAVMRAPMIFALLCSLVCMWINNEIVPRGHEVRRSLTSRLSVGNALDLIEPGVWVSDFPNIQLYAAAKEGNILREVEVVDRSSTNVVFTYRAEQVTVTGEGPNVTFELKNATRTPIDEKNPGTASAANYTQRFKMKDVKYTKKAKDLRFFELLAKISDSRDEVRQARTAAATAVAYAPDKAVESKVRECRRELSKFKVELSKRFVFALASLCFVLVGVPLGIRAQRKESTIGMAISLVIALGYYLFVMLMLSLQKSYAIHPEFLLLLPVGVCLGLSVWFVKRNL